MRPNDTPNSCLSCNVEQRTSGVDHASTHDYAMLEELRFVRREAQAEANLAYESWCRHPCGERYAVYLAAQDRADAAQDYLANCVHQLAG